MNRPYMDEVLVKRSRTMTAFLKHNCRQNLCFDEQGYTTLEELAQVMNVGLDPILQIVALSYGKYGPRFEVAEWAEGVKLIRSCNRELPPCTEIITRLPKPSQTKCERLMIDHLMFNRGHALSFDRDGYVCLDTLAYTIQQYPDVIRGVVAISVEHGRPKFEIDERRGESARIRCTRYDPEFRPYTSPDWPTWNNETEFAALNSRVDELEAQVSRLQALHSYPDISPLIKRVEALEARTNTSEPANQDPSQSTVTSPSPPSLWDLKVTVSSRQLGWSDSFQSTRDFILCPGDAILLLGPHHDDAEGTWRLVKRLSDGEKGWLLVENLPTWPEF